jgi:single-stranded-DNA-specific exonuclease
MDKFDEFSRRINEIADGLLKDSDLIPQVDVDCELGLDSVSLDLAHELRLLEPYGEGNREPVFITARAKIMQRMRMGSNGTHLRLRLGSDSGRIVECVAFGWGELESRFSLGNYTDFCYNIQINKYNGNTSVQAMLRDARSTEV